MILNSVTKYLKRANETKHDKIAVFHNKTRLTYNELYDQSCRVASFIIHKWDLANKKCPIIVFMRNDEKAIASFMGIAMSGNIYVPLDIDLPIERVRTIIGVLNPVGVIALHSVSNEIKELFACPFIKWEEIDGLSYSLDEIIMIENRIIDTDPLYILFTSGSTGVPKGVTVSHKAVIDFTEEASFTMSFSEEEVFLNQAPFYFDASIPDIYCTIANAACLHIIDRELFAFPIRIMEYIETNQINAIYWVPSALITVANMKALGKKDISCLKKIMFCGEVMPVKYLNMWRKEIPNAVYVNYYGPTEGIYASTYYVVDREFTEEETLPIGRAAINTEILLLSDDNQICKQNEVGQIFIRGTGLALGYYNDQQRTEERFIQNPMVNGYRDIIYCTGDLGHYGEDGLIYYDGRKDHQVKHNGYRIELGEIEANINHIEGIETAVVIYNKEKDIVVAFYSGDVDTDTVSRLLAEMLPLYMIPGRIIKKKHIPLNANGKIDRVRLNELCLEEA